ncbi:MAG: hypothetical protein U0800_25535 [Isosphaeraceae bacterium]
MGSERSVAGAIVDSWIERAGIPGDPRRVVLQVAPRGKPRELVIVEVASNLIPDRYWLEDLGENLCHGSPVSASGWMTQGGLLNATQVQLAR